MEANNAAAIREAAKEFVAVMLDKKTGIHNLHRLAEKCRDALSAPPRNCDRYPHDEALSVWAAEKENGKNGCFDEWLYAPAKKGGAK